MTNPSKKNQPLLLLGGIVGLVLLGKVVAKLIELLEVDEAIEVGAESQTETPVSPPPPPAPTTVPCDDLTTISGIGPVFGERLQQGGICSYAQLAAADDDTLRAIVRPLNFQRPDFASWRAQALGSR